MIIIYYSDIAKNIEKNIPQIIDFSKLFFKKVIPIALPIAI